MRLGPEHTLAYTLQEASEVTGLSRQTLRQAIGAGHLKAKRTSVDLDGNPTGRILILRRELEGWLERLPDDWWGPRPARGY